MPISLFMFFGEFVVVFARAGERTECDRNLFLIVSSENSDKFSVP